MNTAGTDPVGVCFVVALGCEAKPILARWKFTAQSGCDFPVYRNGRDWLIVSGVGKVAAAAAAGYLRARRGAAGGVWVNVGIAGSGELSSGEAALACKVTDNDSGESWYPTFVVSAAIPALPLTTFSCPHTDYDLRGMFDMEASGFLSVAQRFEGSEWAQAVKVVSDTPVDSVQAVSAKRVSQWIESGLPAVEEFTENLRSAREALIDEGSTRSAEWIGQFTRSWRFTVYQQHRLERLLRNWGARDPRGEVPWERLRQCPGAQAMLDVLESELQRLPVRLGGALQ